MSRVATEHDLTLWLVDDVPARMLYAGQRWSVTDVPTRLIDLPWSAYQTDSEHGASLHRWRFQATNPAGESVVFDVYGGPGTWHVHRAYN